MACQIQGVTTRTLGRRLCRRQLTVLALAVSGGCSSGVCVYAFYVTNVLFGYVFLGVFVTKCMWMTCMLVVAAAREALYLPVVNSHVLFVFFTCAGLLQANVKQPRHVSPA